MTFPHPSPSPHPSRDDDTPRAGFSVLLADDDAEMRMMLRDILVGMGAEVIEAVDGLILIEHLEAYVRADAGRKPFDLLVTDHQMPGATGAASIEVVRKYEPELPVLLISAFADDALVQRVHDAGTADVLTKPFEPRAFRERVGAMCPMQERMPEAAPALA